MMSLSALPAADTRILIDRSFCQGQLAKLSHADANCDALCLKIVRVVYSGEDILQRIRIVSVHRLQECLDELEYATYCTLIAID